MYNIKQSNGIYYLRHNNTNILAKLDKDQFNQEVIKYFNPTLDVADKISFAIFVGDFKTVNELINL